MWLVAAVLDSHQDYVAPWCKLQRYSPDKQSFIPGHKNAGYTSVPLTSLASHLWQYTNCPTDMMTLIKEARDWKQGAHKNDPGKSCCGSD